MASNLPNISAKSRVNSIKKAERTSRGIPSARTNARARTARNGGYQRSKRRTWLAKGKKSVFWLRWQFHGSIKVSVFGPGSWLDFNKSERGKLQVRLSWESFSRLERKKRRKREWSLEVFATGLFFGWIFIRSSRGGCNEATWRNDRAGGIEKLPRSLGNEQEA